MYYLRAYYLCYFLAIRSANYERKLAWKYQIFFKVYVYLYKINSTFQLPAKNWENGVLYINYKAYWVL